MNIHEISIEKTLSFSCWSVSSSRTHSKFKCNLLFCPRDNVVDVFFFGLFDWWCYWIRIRNRFACSRRRRQPTTKIAWISIWIGIGHRQRNFRVFILSDDVMRPVHTQWKLCTPCSDIVYEPGSGCCCRRSSCTTTIVRRDLLSLSLFVHFCLSIFVDAGLCHSRMYANAAIQPTKRREINE